MSEKLAQQHDKESLSAEQLEAARNTQAERINEQLEQRAERAHEQDAESAKHEALEHASAAEKEAKNELEKTTEKRGSRPHKRSKKMLDQSFKKQMNDVQQDMGVPAKAFSKLIHAKPVEKTSEAIGSTIARPNAILAGSLAAFIVVSAVYGVAKYIGYPLSGFETIGAFVIGWLVGIMIDFFRIMITGKR